MTSESNLYSESLAPIMEEGRARALKTFHEAAQRVPAYRSFLSENGVNPQTVRTFDDFQKLPIITKDNYLRKYSLSELIWDGDRFKADLISVSSGSTGEPFFWLRDRPQHAEAADIYFEIYKDIFSCDKVPTLLVVCFSMGTWIAGSYTTLGAMAANERGLKMNIITPAIELLDAVTVVKRLHNEYGQIILAGCPPFLKDLIDKGQEEGIDWPKLKVGFTAAGEAVSEELRDYFLSRGTSYSDDPTKVVNIYGTVDAGIVANETPLSVILKRLIYKNKTYQQRFGRGILPTLAQYDPRRKFVESIDDSIVFTSATGLPLVRYNIKDSGGVVDQLSELIDDPEQFRTALTHYGLDTSKWVKPFIYIHGRSDFTASLYAVLIYPENIKKAILSTELTNFLTGRFVMDVKYKSNMDQYLEIAVELRASAGASEELRQKVESNIIATLESDNSEYRRLRSAIGERSTPAIILKASGDQQFFSRHTNKQQWKAKKAQPNSEEGSN